MSRCPVSVENTEVERLTLTNHRDVKSFLCEKKYWNIKNIIAGSSKY